jgi:hypothetical protein
MERKRHGRNRAPNQRAGGYGDWFGFFASLGKEEARAITTSDARPPKMAPQGPPREPTRITMAAKIKAQRFVM